MQKNLQKKLILLLVTAAFVITVMGAASAATIPTEMDLDVASDPVHVGDSVTLTAHLEANPTGPNNNFDVSGVNIAFYDTTSSPTYLGSSVTDANGDASFIVTPSTSGDKEYGAYYAGRSDPNPAVDPPYGYQSSYDQEDLEVRSPPSLTVSKSDSPDPVTVGNTLTYTMVVTNTGSSRAYNVNIADIVPSGLTNVQYSTGGGWSSYTSGTLISLGNINGYQSRTFYVRGTVSPSAAGTLTNTARVYTCNTLRAQDTETTTVVRQADLGITKVDSVDPVIAGNELTYTITVTNSGPSTIQSSDTFYVIDTLPANFLAMFYTPSAGTYDSTTGAWTGVTLAPGQSVTLTIDGDVSQWATGTLTNTVTVTPPTGVTDPYPANNTATATTTVNNEANLVVTKSDSPDPVTAGTQLVYAMSITNNGPSVAYAVSFEDVIPAALTGAEYSLDNLVWNPYTSGQNVLLGDIDRAVTVNFWIRGIIDPATMPGEILNTVNVFKGATSGGSATAETIVTNQAPLTITKTPDKAQPNVGDEVTYTITVSNAGPSTATNLVITDTIPAGMEYVGSSDGGSYSAGVVTWNAGNLVAGGEVTRTVTVRVLPAAAGKNVTNTASAFHDESLTDPVTAQASIYVPSADLVLTKTVDKTTPTVKDTVVFTLIVNNNGPDTAVDVTVNDKLPAGLTYVSHVANFGTYDPATGLWTIASLPNGASAVLTITAVVEQSGQIVNQANVTALTWDPNLDDNAASAAMNVQAEPVPVSGKTVDMEKTGAPIFALLVAFFMLVAGMVLPRRK